MDTKIISLRSNRVFRFSPIKKKGFNNQSSLIRWIAHHSNKRQESIISIINIVNNNQQDKKLKSWITLYNYFISILTRICQNWSNQKSPKFNYVSSIFHVFIGWFGIKKFSYDETVLLSSEITSKEREVAIDDIWGGLLNVYQFCIKQNRAHKTWKTFLRSRSAGDCFLE